MAEVMGVLVPQVSSRAANSYGDDSQLDALWDACAAGDSAACDDLFVNSGFNTEYERFGLTCGNRTARGAEQDATL